VLNGAADADARGLSTCSRRSSRWAAIGFVPSARHGRTLRWRWGRPA